MVRPVEDPYQIEWTKWQLTILRKMGVVWADEGRVPVVTSVARTFDRTIEHAWSDVQRGDTLLPFVERPEPPLKSPKKSDAFAPSNGKADGDDDYR